MIMTRYRYIFRIAASAVLLALTASLWQSCKSDQSSPLPEAKGLPYELVLVCPKQMYQGALHDTLEAVLQASTPVLNQHEPLFRLSTVYDESKITAFREFRSRLVLGVDASIKEPVVRMANDVRATPQIEVKITAHDVRQLTEFISDNRERITDLFVEHELQHAAALLRQQYSASTASALRDVCGYTVCVPQSLRASKRGTDFLWTGTNLPDRDMNFVYFSYPWDGGVLTDSAFVCAHDSALQANIPGSRAGQYMQTARVDGKPLAIARMRMINNRCVLEVRGLWDVRGAALGGPFVAQAHVDTLACRVRVAEGFIYSPHSSKRPLLRQMEAALRTFEPEKH